MYTFDLRKKTFAFWLSRPLVNIASRLRSRLMLKSPGRMM